MLFYFLKAGIPINKINDMKSDLEHIAKRSLVRASDLKANYLVAILNAEVELQIEKLKGKLFQFSLMLLQDKAMSSI